MSEVKNFVTVTERSTKAMLAASANLTKTIADLTTLANTSETIAQEIGFRQNELSQVEAEYDQKLAEAKADLRIKVLNNEDQVLGNLLKARGLVTIEPGDLDTLRDNLTAAEHGQEDAIAAAVQQAVAQANREMQARLSQQESQHKVAIAELTANSKAKDDRVTMLTEQLDAARSDLKAERETRLAIAQAESQRQGVVVNAGK